MNKQFKSITLVIIPILIMLILIFSCLGMRVLSNFNQIRLGFQDEYKLEENAEYESLWSLNGVPFIGLHEFMPNVINLGSNFYYITSEPILKSYLVSIDGLNGEVRWKSKFNLLTRNFLLPGDNMIIRGRNDLPVISAFDENDGSKLWNQTLYSANRIKEMYYIEEKLFVYTIDGNFFIINNEGKLIESFSEIEKTFFVLDEILYQDGGNRLIGVDIKTKERIWEINLNRGQIVFSPIIDGENMFIQTTEAIFSIKKATREVNWQSSYNIVSNLCIMNKKIYFLTVDGALMSIDKKTGEQISKVKFTPDQFDLQNNYYIAGDTENQILVISFGDAKQLLGIKIKE